MNTNTPIGDNSYFSQRKQLVQRFLPDDYKILYEFSGDGKLEQDQIANADPSESLPDQSTPQQDLATEHTPEITVILAGVSGNGKSTLGNVLAGRKPEESLFEEVEGCREGTKNVCQKIVQVQHGREIITLRIVDTVGFGDGNLSKHEVILRLTKVSNYCKNGVNQLFFVTQGRLSTQEQEAWRTVQETIFDEELIDYTTIVRTHVPPKRLEMKSWIKEQTDDLCKGKCDLAAIFKKVCSAERIFFVDNPGEYSTIQEWELLRERTKDLLRHLLDSCEKRYTPQRLELFNHRMGGLADKVESQEREIEKLRESIREIRADNETQKNERKRKMI